MPEAILDTGPPLHLHEIGRLSALAIFDGLIAPQAVGNELSRFRVSAALLALGTPAVEIVSVADSDSNLERTRSQVEIQAADAEVLALARSHSFRLPVLSDDLALRQVVLAAGGRVVGSFGILLGAHKRRQLGSDEVRAAVDDLMAKSTLHLGREFRRYMRTRLEQVIGGQ